jgi:hypothetical protein
MQGECEFPTNLVVPYEELQVEPVVLQQPQMPPPQDITLVPTLDDLAEAISGFRERGEPILINQLTQQLRNVIAICVQQPKFLVARRHNNTVMTVAMTEKQLYKLLREIGLITYVEIKTTEIDKIVRKEVFQSALRMWQRGDDGFYHELQRNT